MLCVACLEYICIKHIHITYTVNINIQHGFQVCDGTLLWAFKYSGEISPIALWYLVLYRMSTGPMVGGVRPVVVTFQAYK